MILGAFIQNFSYTSINENDEEETHTLDQAWVRLQSVQTNAGALSASFFVYANRSSNQVLDTIGLVFLDSGESPEVQAWRAFANTGQYEFLAEGLPDAWTSLGHEQARMGGVLSRFQHTRPIQDTIWNYVANYQAIPDWAPIGENFGHILQWNYYLRSEVEVVNGQYRPINGIFDPTHPSSLCHWSDFDTYFEDDPTTGPGRRERRTIVWSKSGTVYYEASRSKRYDEAGSVEAGRKRRKNVSNAIKNLVRASIVSWLSENNLNTDPSPLAALAFAQVGQALLLFEETGLATPFVSGMDLLSQAPEHVWITPTVKSSISEMLGSWLS